MKINNLIIKKNNKVLVDIKDIVLNKTALIGESGSGKSLSLKAILNMLNDFEVVKDFDFSLTNEQIGFIPQNPFTSLSPLTKIKKNFFISKEEIKYLFDLISLDEYILERYPIELSGGQIQRVVIAIALSNRPKLLLLDEPTTALDTKNKQNFINIINSLQDKLGFKFLFVTHDIYSIKDITNELYILKDGTIVEKGIYNEILANPKQHYTKKLIECSFENKDVKKDIPIITI